MKKKTLLIIGEEKITRTRPYLSFLKFVKYAQELKGKGVLEIKVISYAQLLLGQAPQIGTSKILVVFFFPYKYWNRNIEVYRDGRIYGDEKFGREFKSFFRKVKKVISKYYAGKRIRYLNPPEACYLDRDKQGSKNLLSENAVLTPRSFRISSFDDIQRLLKKGLNLYIKPRFGAMGKGITYLNRDNAISNFLYRKGEVINRPSDFNWRFSQVKDRQRFLNKLIEKGFICEEAITSATLKGRRFDFRVYVLFGKVVYLYAKSSGAGTSVTNWSQGGRIDKRKTILNTIPKEKIAVLQRLAKKATRTLGLNFAGIDIIFSKDLKKAYVLEGNAFPGYEKGFDLMKCLLDSLLR